MYESSIKTKFHFPFKDEWDGPPMDNEIKGRLGRQK